MKLSRFLIIAIAASTSFLTACTSEEEEASARHELVFQLGMGNAETRATPEGTWTVGDFIAVKVGNTVKQYKITSTDGKAEGINAANTFCWEDLGVSSVKVTAWSFGSEYYETIPDVITIKTDQSSEENYTASDFLYAKETTITQGAPLNLTFYHQMTYLGFHINIDKPVDIKSVVIGDDPEWPDAMFCYIKANYTEPTINAEGNFPNFGEFEVDYDEEGIMEKIIAHKGDNVGNTKTFTAILVPYAYYESIPVVITLEDDTKFCFWMGMDSVRTPDCEVGGRQFYTINIRNNKLSVSGATGAGPAVYPEDWQVHQ